jgi:hypothetical protein
MTFNRNRRVLAALIATACLAPATPASADPLPSTHKSDAAQAGYAGSPADPLPSTHKSDAAQGGYAGTPVDAAAPTTIEVVRPERTIVRDVDEPLPLILSSTALLLAFAGIGVVMIRTRMAPRAGH